MGLHLAAPAAESELTRAAGDGCPWWDLACQGGDQVADSGLSAITHSTIDGLIALFSMITKVVDESTQVPLADPTYRETYFGFVGLAVPVIAVVYFLALIAAALRRDPRTLVRATVGVAVAAIGGAVYIVLAQLLVALDDWLASGVVGVTGADFRDQMQQMAGAFERMGAGDQTAANMLLLVLMWVALLAGVCLWLVLLLRQIAILVVVVFAPLLMAGWLWGPTRAWSRKATEMLVALIFTKTVIYVIFGVGMRLLLRADSQTLSDLVAVVVLLLGACFAPLVMLRFVRFAADSRLTGEMLGSLRSGATPVAGGVQGATHRGLRSSMARDYAGSSHRSASSPGQLQPGAARIGPQPASAPRRTAASGVAAAAGAAIGASTSAASTALKARPPSVRLLARRDKGSDPASAELDEIPTDAEDASVPVQRAQVTTQGGYR